MVVISLSGLYYAHYYEQHMTLCYFYGGLFCSFTMQTKASRAFHFFYNAYFVFPHNLNLLFLSLRFNTSWNLYHKPATVLNLFSDFFYLSWWHVHTAFFVTILYAIFNFSIHILCQLKGNMGCAVMLLIIESVHQF